MDLTFEPVEPTRSALLVGVGVAVGLGEGVAAFLALPESISFSVASPATPSAVSPLRLWNALTAFTVPSP